MEYLFNKLTKKLLKHKKIGVFSHVRPDGDCIGAQIGLCLWLQKNGVEARAFNEDPAPENLQWMESYFPLEHPEGLSAADFDAFVFVDGNSLHRFGDFAKTLDESGLPLYAIDHHPQPDEVFEESVIITEYSSTCELIYYLYEEHDPEQLDEEAARALYTGILTDTGSFQFESVKPRTFEAAAKLTAKGGFTPDEIVEKIYSARPLRQLKLLSKALDTIKTFADGTISIIVITKDMMEATGTGKEDTEGFVAHPLSLKGVKAAVLFRENNEGIKISLRSRSDIDVNVWARELDGGGHQRAAGAWHAGPMDKAIQEVIDIGKKQL